MALGSTCMNNTVLDQLASLTRFRYDVSNALTAAGAKGTFFFSTSFLCSIVAVSLKILTQMEITVRTPHQLISWICQPKSYPGGCIYDSEQVKRVKFAYNAGHQVASHTWAHKDLTKLTWDQSELRFKILSWLVIHHLLVHDEMWRVERKYLHSFSFIYLILKICRGTDENHWSLPGLYATSYASPISALLLFFTPQHPAYGNYNDLVLEASGIRGQSVVIWDFEYVSSLCCEC